MKKWLGLILFVIAIDSIAQTTDSKEIKLAFIAMQYYGGILNRSYVIQVSDSLIFGGKVYGLMSATITRGYPKSAIEDPYFYVDSWLLSTYQKSSKIQPDLVNIDNANFLIKRTDIASITYTPKKKWGMGSVVHTGKFFISLKTGKKIELIPLGKPDIDSIVRQLNAKDF